MKSVEQVKHFVSLHAWCLGVTGEHVTNKDQSQAQSYHLVSAAEQVLSSCLLSYAQNSKHHFGVNLPYGIITTIIMRNFCTLDKE